MSVADAAEAARQPTLGGIRVLDLSRAVSGPFVGRILADLGADVVKVDSAEGDVSDQFGRVQAHRSGLYAQMNAGKRVIRLDFRAPADVQVVRDLAAQSDVVIENYRVGALDKLGLGYADLASTNPALVYLSISGFGATSPEADRRAYAPIIHAESGMLTRQARLDSVAPADLPLALADSVAALHGTIAILAALRRRDSTNHGQHIDLSMLEALIASDDQVHYAMERDGTSPQSRGLIWDAPGGPILFAVELGATWKFLSRAHGLVDPGSADAEIAEKAVRRKKIVQEWILSFETRPELQRAVGAAGITWAEVRAPEDLLDQASLAHCSPFDEVGDGAGGTRRVVRMPYRFSHATDAVVGDVQPVTQVAATIAHQWEASPRQ
jgi:CoA:oxalate CoA-transferase